MNNETKEKEQEEEGKTIFEHLGSALGIEQRESGGMNEFIPKIKKIALLFVMAYIGGVIADTLLGTSYLSLVIPAFIAFTLALKLYKKFEREEKEAKRRNKNK